MSNTKPRDAALWQRIREAAATRPFVRPAMDEQRFGQILLGKRCPSEHDLVLIADAFEVTVAWLQAGGDGPQ